MLGHAPFAEKQDRPEAASDARVENGSEEGCGRDAAVELEVAMQEEVSEFAAFVGIDWASRKHDICLQVGRHYFVKTDDSTVPDSRSTRRR
jgi:hypothetical protein